MAAPLPRERVVLAVDVGAEMFEDWDARKPERGSRASVVLGALQNFVERKALVSPTTTWAVVALRDGAAPSPLLEYTGEREAVVATLRSLATPEVGGDDATAEAAPFDPAVFFSSVDALRDVGRRPADVVDRCVLVFARARAVPMAMAETPALLDDPRFHFDAIYVHAKAADDNYVQAVFLAVTDLAAGRPRDASFFFETTASLGKLHQSFAILLAHPGLRDEQDAIAEKLAREPGADAEPENTVVMTALA